MLVGYSRVSTTDQSLDLQTDALAAAGCQREFNDVASGAKAERPGLTEALEFLREGDTLVVWKLDRLGRSLPHLIEIVNLLESRGVGFRSMQENLDTTTAGGRLLFHIMGALAEFERGIIRERTRAGLTAARARGRKGGRPRAMAEGNVRAARQLLSAPAIGVSEVCRALNVSRSTLYRTLARATPSKPKAVGARGNDSATKRSKAVE